MTVPAGRHDLTHTNRVSIAKAKIQVGRIDRWELQCKQRNLQRKNQIT